MKIEDMILMHYDKYPKMEVTDYVKLIYQSEFGCGHLIENEMTEFLIKYLENEINSFDDESEITEIKFDDIGNGLTRINLNKNAYKIGLDNIIKAMKKTADGHNGDESIFRLRLLTLERLCLQKKIPLDITILREYLKEYEANGYPVVSHGEVYKNAYNPCYRVVDINFKNYLDVFILINEKMKNKNNIIIGIDGKSGSGKTFLSNYIACFYDADIIHMDDFFLTLDMRTDDRFNEIGGNISYERFENEVVQNLKNKKTFTYKKYSCKDCTFYDSDEISTQKIVIIEGCYSFHKHFTLDFDIKIFLDIEFEKQLDRITKRSDEFLLDNFKNIWIPSENKYFNDWKIKESSDLVLDTTDF